MKNNIDETNDSFPVICIQEFKDSDNTELDTTIFIAYDDTYDEFVLYGKRRDPPHCKDSNFAPFSFRFERTDDVYDFLKLVISIKCDNVFHNVILYNYNNFPLDFNVTYNFLYNNMNFDYEIAGYTNVKLDRKYVKNILRMCRSLYNRASNGTIV